MSTASQSAQILEYLKAGNAITPLEALDMFGCFRLGARIYDLRKAGHPIDDVLVTSNGKKFSRYFLERKKALAGSPEPFSNALVATFDGAAATG